MAQFVSSENERIMNSKPLLVLALVLSAGLFGLSNLAWCADGSAINASISPQAEMLVRQVADYYQNLTSFQGTNSIYSQSSGHVPPFVYQKQFAFLRPNKFSISAENKYNSWLFCDGTYLWEYNPSYFNSYTKTPAPARFEDAITNWLGGELLHVMVDPDRYHYIMNGFRLGMAALKYDGEEVVAGVTCHHLSMEAPQGRAIGLWVATGASPYILKLTIRSPISASTNQFTQHTEIISGWKTNKQIPERQFTFVPPAGAIEHPPGADAVETSVDPRTRQTTTRFYNPASHADNNVAANQADGTNASIEISSNVMLGSNPLGKVSVKMASDYSNVMSAAKELLGTNYAPALAAIQTNYLPALANSYNSEFGAAADFLHDLKERGDLPGVPKGSHGNATIDKMPFSEIQNPTYPFIVTINLVLTGDSLTNHYTVVRPAKDAPWHLQKAWRTGADGQTAVEWPTK